MFFAWFPSTSKSESMADKDISWVPDPRRY